MYKIEQLHVQNFMSIEDIELSFNKGGIYTITGYDERNGDSNGSGKCLPLDAPVLMSDGSWRPLKDIRVGDWVMSPDLQTKENKPAPIIATTRSGIKKVYKISFSDGGYVVASAEHEFPAILYATTKEYQYTKDSPSKYIHFAKFKKRTVQELIDKGKSNVKKATQRSSFFTYPTYFYEQDLPVDSYLIGLLLGDGMCNLSAPGYYITNIDPEILDYCRAVSEKEGYDFKNSGITYKICPKRAELSKILDSLGLKGKRANTKSVPLIYMRGSYEQRKALLAGLVDTDGYVGSGSGIELSTRSTVLKDQVLELFYSLGGRAKAYLRPDRLNWRLFCHLPKDCILPLKVARKYNAHINKSKKGIDYSKRTIRTIELVGEVECGDIQVFSRDRCFVSYDHVVTGNSSILNSIVWAIHGRTSKGLSGDSVTRRGSQASARVEIQFRGANEHTCTIIRTPETVNFLLDSVETRGHRKDIQTTINDTFRTSYDLFLSTVMFTRESDFLTDSGDAAKKRLFKSLLGLEQIDKMAEKAKTICDSLFKDTIQMEYFIKHTEENIQKALGELDKYLYKDTDWEVEKAKKIRGLQDSIKEAPVIDERIDRDKDDVEEDIDELKKLLKQCEENLPGVQERLSVVYKEIGYHTKRIEDYRELILDAQGLQGASCDYCGAKLTKKGRDIHLEGLQDCLRGHEESVENYRREMLALEKAISDTENVKEKLNFAEKEYLSLERLLSAKLHQIELFEENKKQILERIQAETASSNPYSSLIEVKKQELDSLQLTLEDSKKKFKELTTNIDTYAYIKWVLSREGVVSAIIEKTFGRLEALINNYLSSISTQGFQIQIKPQKELKSGAFKEAIDIVILQDGKKQPYASLSGGQEQRVTIAVLMSLYKLSKELGMNRFDMLLLDEVLDLSLDNKGQQDIVRLLHNLNEEIHNIFVISHKEGIADDFHFQIDVRRDLDGITHLNEVIR